MPLEIKRFAEDFIIEEDALSVVNDGKTLDGKTKFMIRKMALEASNRGFVASSAYGGLGKKPSTEATKLSIVILTYNNLADTKRCISSIISNTATSYEIIVVDNNSTDGTQEWLNQKWREGKIHKLVLNKENHGVAGGRNQGMRIASGNYIAILDNDVVVFENWDSIFLEELKKQWGSVAGINGNNVVSLNPLIFKRPDTHEKIFEVDVVPGCCMIFPKSLLDEVGMFDENMPNPNFWHEDLDFCKRVQLIGKRIMSFSSPPLIHKGNLSHKKPEEAPFGFYENAAYIDKKYSHEDKLLRVYRWVHPGCSESYCVLADNISRVLRDQGWTVLRLPHIDTPPETFSLCKAFELKYKGTRFVIMHLENDRPPRSWLEAFKQVDFAFNVSPHAYNALIKHGFDEKKMINVSPNGINPKDFNFNVEPYDPYPGTFKFFTVGAAQPRKGTDVLIKAYFREFTDKDNTILIIKDYAYGWKKWVDEIVEKERAKNPHAPRFVHIFEDWDTKKLAGFYKACALNGAFIHPHKGECFGLPMVEAMACGCRVGVTDYTGSKYLIRNYPSEMVNKFPFKFQESWFQNGHGHENAYEKNEHPQWAVADIEAVRATMRRFYLHPYSKRLGKKTSDKILERFNWETTVKKFGEEILNHASA